MTFLFSFLLSFRVEILITFVEESINNIKRLFALVMNDSLVVVVVVVVCVKEGV